MSEVKLNIEEGKTEDEEVSYTIRGIPISVHDAVESYRKEIVYKRDRKYNMEQAYVEALKDWSEARKELKKTAL